jgi:hypothetical protein
MLYNLILIRLRFFLAFFPPCLLPQISFIKVFFFGFVGNGEEICDVGLKLNVRKLRSGSLWSVKVEEIV